MVRTLHDRALQALTDRNTWEEKQRLWYTMRHLGLSRRNKPFPGAADLHLPLGDNAVEKQKPFFVNSVFSRQQLASFTALQADEMEASAAAAECLDWKLRKESNFRREFDFLIDSMLVCGRAVLKLRWDTEARRLVFESIDPLYFIVPKACDELEEADFCVHVKQYSVAAYMRDKRYRQEPEFVARIKGGREQADRMGKDQDKATREGVTYTAEEDTVVVWEAWEKCEAGWKVHTYSPCLPGEPIRPPFVCAYRKQGKPWLPFVAWQWEVTEKGWYAPRGIVEKVAPYETYGTKCWNGKADFLEYSMRPIFTSQPGYEIKNSASVRIRPGEIMPPGLMPAAMPEPPMSLDTEINSVREIAEESVQSPDFGVQREGAAGGSDKRTATEIGYVQSFASQGIQYRGQIFAQPEGETYGKAWALLVQFAGDEIAFFAAKSRKVLPAQARHDNYLIEPDAQADAWNKTLRAQRAAARLGMFRGDADIDQIELKRSVLEADDARLVVKLLIGQGTKAADESEDEAKDILLLEAGWPAQSVSVKPAEDHALRLRVLFGRLDMLNKLGVPPNPMVARNIQQHVVIHLNFLRQQNPAMAKQFTEAIAAVGGGGDGSGAGDGSNGMNASDGMQGAAPGPALMPGPEMPEEAVAV